MRIFVAGATGVIGRRVVPLLLRAGHQVVGLSRSARNRERLGAQGAEPREADLFDREGIVARTADCDAILHLATAIPTGGWPGHSAWRLNDRIRIEGTANLLEAAVRNGSALYLQQSVTFLYGDQQGAWVDESVSPSGDLPAPVRSAVVMERLVAEAASSSGLPAVTLRFGMFYAPDSVQTRRLAGAARRGMLPIIGPGTAWWNLVHADDAAHAVAAAIGRREVAASRTFNICEDTPVTASEFATHLARLTGGRTPVTIPTFLARWLLGEDTVSLLQASARCRNDQATGVLGWQPRHRFQASGLPQLSS